MPLARIVHWRPAESRELLDACQSGGWKVDYHVDPTGPAVTRGIRENIPDAVVIDLSRMPSHGREIAVWLRSTKRTRHIPIVLVNGDDVKVDAVRELLPDALYTTTGGVAAVLNSLGDYNAPDPVVPRPMMERYGIRTTAEKLGIAPDSTVGAIDAPMKYATVIGPLPEGVDVTENPRSVQQVTLWFVHDMGDLSLKLRRMVAMADKTKLWLVWRKRGSNGVSQNGIREAAIAVGLVDYKICAMGLDWSGILFARRKR